MTVIATVFGRLFPYQPLQHKWIVCFQKMNPLASKLLVLEPKEIANPDLENLDLTFTIIPF